MIRSLLSRLGQARPAAPREERLPPGVRVYAIGDVHGRADLLDRLYAEIAADLKARPAEKVMEVFLGDYVDRGPNSKDVIDWMLTGPRVAHKRICLRGNHELMMQAFLEDASVIGSWGQFGGLETLYSYGVKVKLPLGEHLYQEVQQAFRAALPESHAEFLRSLRPMASVGGYFFAHAGVNPAKPLAVQIESDLYWIREPFLRHHRRLEKVVVHGHTPVEEPEVEVHRIGIDTGAYITGRLTCAVLDGSEVSFLST
jgi:serine/threonine protein phosphatase 1